MKCGVWKKIQNELDAGSGFSPSVQAHLVTCPRCARDLAVYQRLIRSYGKEAVSPVADQISVYALFSRSKPMLAATAAVFMFLVVAGGLVSIPRFQDAALHREYFREFSESIIDGGLFEYAHANDTGYESSWF